MRRGHVCAVLVVLALVPAWTLAQVEAGSEPVQAVPGEVPVQAEPAEPPHPGEPVPAPWPGPSPEPRNLLVGMVVLGGVPLGDFGDVVGGGFGLASHLVLTPGRQPFGLRLEVSGLEYGSETIAATVADTGGRVQTADVGLHVTTTNDFFRLALGPQLTARHGRLRPYVYATVGGSRFYTTSILDDDEYDDESGPLATTTNYSDWTFSLDAGGGLLIQTGRRGLLELGVRYVANRPVDWLAEGDLMDDPNGPARPRPRHSAVHLVEMVVGFALAF